MRARFCVVFASRASDNIWRKNFFFFAPFLNVLSFLQNGIFSSLTKNKTKQIEEEEEEKLVLSRYVRHDWSDDDDERNAAEKPDDREERFFVGFDREERRYLFHAYSSEIAFDGCEILVRGEYGDEKVD